MNSVDQDQISTEEIPAINSIEDWEKVSLVDKQRLLHSVLLRNKRDLDFLSDMLSERAKTDYLVEFSYLLGMVAAAESEDGIAVVATRLARTEDVFIRETGNLVVRKVLQELQGIEKGLAVATGIISPERIAEIRSRADALKAEAPGCTTREQQDNLIKGLFEAKDMLSH